MSKGIDIPIDKLVANFNSNLWTTNTVQYYGRCFRNERFEAFQTTISPEIWQSANDYIEVLKDDTKDATCFFDVEPESNSTGEVFTANVRILFLVNLSALYPALTKTEATEQVHKDVQEIIDTTEFEITGLVRGFNGFTDYDWGENADQAKTDMYPHYLFRFNTEIEYNNKNC